MTSVKQACRNYFNLLDLSRPSSENKKGQALEFIAMISIFTLIVPAAVGLVYGISTLIGNIKKCGSDPKIERTASAVLSPSNSSASASSSSSLSEIDNTERLLEIAEQLEQPDADTKPLLEEWNEAFQERLVTPSELAGPFIFDLDAVRIFAGLLQAAPNLKLFLTRQPDVLSNPKAFDKAKVQECKEKLDGENPSDQFWMEVIVKPIGLRRPVDLNTSRKVREVPQFVMYWFKADNGAVCTLDFNERQDAEKVGVFNLFRDYQITEEAVQRQKTWMEGLE
jgi:hypothetical protein